MKTPHTNARTYNQSAVSARFLLGGIGAGNISMDACGALRDFEIFGRPNKRFDSPYTFFAIRTCDEAGNTHARALEAQKQPPFDHSHGFNAWEVGGVSRFASSKMWAEYPFVTVQLTDEAMPISVEIEAVTPFIPLATDDSSLPGFLLRYTVHNRSSVTQQVSVAGSFANLCDYTYTDVWSRPLFGDGSVNTLIKESGYTALAFSNKDRSWDDLAYTDMTVAAAEQEVTALAYWNEGMWWDGLQDFWNDFVSDGRLTEGRTVSGIGGESVPSKMKIGSLCVQKSIEAGGSQTFDFVIAWQHPNLLRSWEQTEEMRKAGRPILQSYSSKFGRSPQVVRYLLENRERLVSQSRSFADALYGSTLPEEFIDAVASTLTVLRSGTCFRVADGTFFGFEGCFDDYGCCDGNCTHVWNYAQTVAFLFPELEQSMRRTEFTQETAPDGRMSFRARNYLGDEPWGLPPAVDGQMGCVIRLYREWQLSGDDALLRELWPAAKRALEFAFTHWDSDGDGVPDSRQHNTYDIEFYGMSSMLSGIFFTALRAGEQMSRYLGDEDSAKRYRTIADSAAVKLDSETFNGEYYEQRCDSLDSYKYQYGSGCLTDQLFGQQLAHINGLGYILPKENVQRAIAAIYKYNYRNGFGDHNNLQRTYALNDESGLILCSWPNGGRPEFPFVYSDEAWTGVEYQVATHLIYEGRLEDARQIVCAVRSRHDGIRRSPWNEVECGHHYARSMASYGLLLAYSGFHCDAVHKKLSFSPITDQAGSFDCFFCCGAGWGIFHLRRDAATGNSTASIETLFGDLSGYTTEIKL